MLLPSQKNELTIYRYINSVGTRPVGVTIDTLSNATKLHAEDLVERLKALEDGGRIALFKHEGATRLPRQVVVGNQVIPVGNENDFFYKGSFKIEINPTGRSYFEELEGKDEENRQSERELDSDRQFALLAIEEARKSVAEDGKPRPKVGAVVVKDGRILEKAHRGENPKSHAEYIALENKLPDDVVSGATVYTTLEPCTTRNHPKIPCVQRLIERKIARVVIGMIDPNPDIQGHGIWRLRDANIEVQLFPADLANQVEEMNREFIREQRHRQKFKTKESIPQIADPKIKTILSFKNKLVSVFIRQKHGHGYLEGYWPSGATVIDCNDLWVTLENPDTKSSQTFALSNVVPTFDTQNNRLKLTLET